ncbi:hypothetical protein ACJJTC_018674 [Scirpophaga incertulas]
MGTQRSPPARSCGSQPNLTQLKDDEFSNQVITRKRKTPECDSNCVLGFQRQLNSTFAQYRQELKETLMEFQKGLTKSFESLMDKQNQNITQINNELNNIRSEISNIKECNQKTQAEHIKIVTTTNNLKNNIETWNTRTQSLENDLEVAKQQIKELADQLRRGEQYCRLNNLEISGVPCSKTENLHTILHKISVKIGFSLSPSDINHIQRVKPFVRGEKRKTQESYGEQSQPVSNIIVCFTQRRKKNDFLAAVRARRGRGALPTLTLTDPPHLFTSEEDLVKIN